MNQNSQSINGQQNTDSTNSKNTAIHNQIVEERAEQPKRVVPVKSLSDLSDDELQERRDVPAYLRRNVKLKEMPHSSESSNSRYKVDEDNELLGGNRFLHDNVD